MSPARYGQHFLIDQTAIQKIVEAVSPTADDFVLEIGPGKGAITQKILASKAGVYAVEVDTKMIDILRSSFGSHENFTLIQSDILKFDFGTLPSTGQADQPYKVVGNLPYSITSPILRHLSNWKGWKQAIIMVQKEVGDRLCAEVGTGDYGALTVGMSLTCEMEPLFDLSEDSFRPKPKIRSSVVRLLRRDNPLTEDIDRVQRVIQAAFQQRRKTLLNSLSHGLNYSKDEIKEVLESRNVDPMLRPERLSVQKFIDLASQLIKS